MVRTSRFHERRQVYFFGLTRHIFENFSQLANAIIAFVLADTSEVLLIPAQWLWEQRHKLSADAKQFKLEIDKSLRLKVLSSAGKSVDLRRFHEHFDILTASTELPSTRLESKGVQAKHSELQGMLLEIGNLRGFQTHCPNKAPRYKGTPLGELATLKTFPEFPGLNTDIVRQIDVIWLERSFPVHAFEVELTTGIWPGLVRLAELRRLNTVLHVITDTDGRTFHRRISGDVFAQIVERCHHASADDVQTLYEAEARLRQLRSKLTL